LRTDVRYVLSGGSWLIANQIGSFFITFGFLWVFTNFLPKEIYGEYRFITTAASLLAITTLPGMGIAVAQSVAKGNTGMIKQVMRTKIIWGLLGSSLAVLTAGYYWLANDPRLALLFLCVAVAVPFLESFAIHLHYLNGIQKFRRYASTRIIQRSIVALCTIIALLLSGDIVIIIATFFLSSIVGDFLMYLTTLKAYPPSTKTDPGVIPYGMHLSVMSALRLGAQYVDKIMLWYVLGPVSVASYVVAMAIPQEMTSGVSNISKLALPKMSIRSKTALRQSLLRKTKIFALLTIPLIIGYILIAPYIFTYIFPQYSDITGYSQFAALIIIFSANGLLMQYFYATENKKVLYVQNIFEPLILLTLFAILIPAFGIWGAIIALLGKNLALTILLIVAFMRDRTDPEQPGNVPDTFAT
jgi:O-antigen/teichoic acid export membrane protein